MEYYEPHFLDLSPSIHQAVDLPATHSSINNLSEPDSPLYNPYPLRVSEKLLHNKIRKLQLQYKQQQEKQNLLMKRRLKQKQIFQFQRKREHLAQQQRENNLKLNRFQLLDKKKAEQEKRQHKLSQLQARDAMIDLCRKKVEEKKNQYIVRIQTKTRERQERAEKKRKIIQKSTEKINDEIHFEEWKNYQHNIMKKHTRQIQPDRLYQDFKKKNIILKEFLRAKSKQNTEIVILQNEQPKNNTASQPQIRVVKTEKPSIQIKVNKKAEFYGVHQEDMIKKTLKDLPRMRKFIEDHTVLLNPCQDDQLLDKFENYLLQEIL